MKKKTFILPFKSNFFKEQDPFHLVIVFFLIFFGTAIFFSIPTFYDYEKYKVKIEKTINNEFKFKLYNLENISFKFIPSPHLLIKKADFKVQDNEKDLISNIENIKVFISIRELYTEDRFKIKKIIIDNANFYVNNLSFNNIINNLKTNIVNNLFIKKSNLFFKDQKNEIILISTIKTLNYKTDLVNKKKILKINGNIFDTDFNFMYAIDYKFPNLQKTYLELKNPNLIFENSLMTDHKSNKNYQNGNLEIKFLNKKNLINYEIINNNINIKNKYLNNSTFDLNGYIDFEPFHFNLDIDLKKISLEEIENLLFKIFENSNLKYENLSGNLKLNFVNIDHKTLNKGILNLNFENSKLDLKTKNFFLSDFAIIEIDDYEYSKESGQVLQMKIKVNILNKEKFNRYLFNYRKDKISEENIYFIYRFDSSNKTSFISQISYSGFGNNSEYYQFKNIQQLKNLLRDDNLFNLD